MLGCGLVIANHAMPHFGRGPAMPSNGPLAGVRLIEMDAIGPVPLCGMILSGLGADVVRVARPGGQPAFDDLGEAVLYRGRTTVEIDLKSEAGREALLTLVEQADGLIEGLRPGVMERLGLGPQVCLDRNPRLVYGRSTGWGQDGPGSRKAGHDINYISMTGALHAIAQAGQGPTVPLNLVGDYGGGTMFLALGMVSAILAARTTGKGQIVDAAIVDGVANLLGLFHAFLDTGTWQDTPATNVLDGASPFYRCYLCEDGGYVAVGSLEPQFFAQLLAGLGIPDGRFEQYNSDHWPEMERAFALAFGGKPRRHWEELFADSDACVTPVLSMREAMTHPVNVARGVFVSHGGVMQAAPAPRFSATPGTIQAERTLDVGGVLDLWRDEAARPEANPADR
jgi:alpha-methylacyl-CoA racemase